MYAKISQTHRLAEAWKRPVEVIWPNSLVKQGHLGHFAQHHLQMTFQRLQGGRLHSLSEQPVPALSYFHNK